MGKGKSRAAPLEEYSESEDEWEQERVAKQGASTSAGRSSSKQWQNYDDDDEEEEEEQLEDGEDQAEFAQFESDAGEELDDEEEDEEAALGREIQTIPFASLLKAQKKLSKASLKRPRSDSGESSSEEEDDDEAPRASSSKKRNGREAERGGSGSGANSIGVGSKERKGKNGRPLKKERSSKHAPMEMSSKKAVGRARTIVETSTKSKARDPRFDSLSGSFKPSLFTTSYSFLTDLQKTELEALRKTSKEAKKDHRLGEEEKERIESALKRMEGRVKGEQGKKREEEVLREWKKAERGKRGEGKREWWLKKSEQKSLLLKAKFDDLSQDKKQLRKSVEKKRRKIAQKDKKLIPRERVASSSGF